MRCLKCGDKTRYHQVFCPKCLAHMAENPVSKDAVPVLPDRKKYTVKKVRPPKPEEVIADLQKAGRIQKRNIRMLRIALILLLAAMGLLIWYGLESGIISRPPALPFGWQTTL